MKIIQISPFYGDIIDTVLNNRGVVNRDLFLNPDGSTDSDPELLKNAEEGLQLLMSHMTKEHKKISIVVDQDADGYCSSVLMYKFIWLYGQCDLEYILHEEKEHGLTEKIMKKIFEQEPTLVIVPDAGSNNSEEINNLYEKGIEVLVIDHHQVTNKPEKGIIVNNQLCDNTNHRLVGVGMVYKFLELYKERYCKNNDIFPYCYLDLVAVGQIGDSSDISDPEIRNIVLKGLDNIKNKFLLEVIDRKGLDIKNLSAKDLAFNVIPIINAVTRVGTLQERETLFKAMAEIDQEFHVVKKKKNKLTNKFENIPQILNIYQFAYDVCMRCKSRQDSLVKKMVYQIEKNLVDDCGIIISISDNKENKGITGLVANKIAAKYDKPALILNEYEDTFAGSGRGKENVIKDFRQWCEDSGVIEFAQGHDNAFGFSIKKEFINQFKEYARKIEKREIVYEVDLITDKPDKDMCLLIEEHKRLFGGSVSEPFIGIENMIVPKKFISVNGSVLNIYSWGVSCTLFNADISLYEKMMDYPDDNYVRLSMVGSYGINNWNGEKTPKFFIKDLEIIYNNNVDDIIF